MEELRIVENKETGINNIVNNQFVLMISLSDYGLL